MFDVLIKHDRQDGSEPHQAIVLAWTTGEVDLIVQVFNEIGTEYGFNKSTGSHYGKQEADFKKFKESNCNFTYNHNIF